MKQKFNITGMTCSACSARVEKVSNALPGMKSAAVNLLSNSMMAEYDEGILTPALSELSDVMEIINRHFLMREWHMH